MIYQVEKYRKLLQKYGLELIVHNTEEEQEPIQRCEFNGHQVEITLNVPKIEKSDSNYEGFLAYNVRSVLLPQLYIETERLIIRRYETKDAAPLYEMDHDRNSCYMDGGYEPSEQMDEAYFEKMAGFAEDESRYVIAHKDTNEAFGLIHLMPTEDRVVDTLEIGYIVNPSQCRKGYAFEAVNALVEVLLEELHLDMIIAGAIEENVPSLNMLKKLGFTYEGKRHKAFWYPPKGPVDMMMFYKERKNAE